MFSSRQLKVFIAMAEECSYKHAAGRLCLTVPPVFKMVKEIEAWAECKLFTNVNGKITMTREGLDLYQELQPIFNKLNNIKIKKHGGEIDAIQLTTDVTDSHLIMSIACFFMGKNIEINGINKTDDYHLNGDIHISTVKAVKVDDGVSERFFKEKVMIQHSIEVSLDLSSLTLVQESGFYTSSLYYHVLPQLYALGYCDNGIVVDNRSVREEMVSKGCAATIDSQNYQKNMKGIMSVSLGFERCFYFYIKKNISKKTLTLVDDFLFTRHI